MPKVPSYDVIVIGTGSAGFSAIEAARSLGASVCVIEKDRFGGECPNYACVPSKAILKAAAAYRFMGHAREFGMEIGGRSFDFKKVMNYRQKVVDTITGGGEYGDRYVKILEQHKVDSIIGEASFVDPHTIEVNGKNISGKTIVVATGTVDFIPPIPGLSEIKYWGWKEALAPKRRTKSMAIIGGGPVGCEIAMFYVSFGTRVILLQTAPVVLQREDLEISKLAEEALLKAGVEIHVNVQIQEVISANGGVTGIKIHAAGGPQMLAVETVVVATGKRPNIDSLGLEDAGVTMDKDGRFTTSKDQRTNVKHIFAAGDVDGGLQFTHTAHYEGWIAGNNAALVAKRKRTAPDKRDMRVVPRVTYIDPEVASVGMTETEARNQYKKLLIGRYDVAALGRAVTDNSRFGLIKIIAHPTTRKILGAHMIGERSGEVIHEAAMAMFLGAKIDKLAEMIHAFPTYSEGLKAAAASASLE
ncbi:MAG: NAD(P)/FAD-dependent oxidoreductase [Parcubacteria group bacterium]|nr:NAD(P)/FAD-dependent oxidoreductase [Parcubacteria group bacterium]